MTPLGIILTNFSVVLTKLYWSNENASDGKLISYFNQLFLQYIGFLTVKKGEAGMHFSEFSPEMQEIIFW